MSTPKTKLTVLISGSGSNLQALIDACGTPALQNAEIIRVVSNKKAAFGLERAKKAQIPTAYHNLLEYKKRFAHVEKARSEYDHDLAALVLADKPDLVVCAGWMHILAPTFLEPLKKAGVPVINLHPALPGQFNGAHAIDEAYKAFQEGKIEKTGIMIHYVILEVDMGEPIVTKEIPMRKGESQDDLETRIHENEWKLIVQGTQKAIDTLQSSRQTGQ
jgi:phosphoribosylglycinamide formyltransferase